MAGDGAGKVHTIVSLITHTKAYAAIFAIVEIIGKPIAVICRFSYYGIQISVTLETFPFGTHWYAIAALRAFGAETSRVLGGYCGSWRNIVDKAALLVAINNRTHCQFVTNWNIADHFQLITWVATFGHREGRPSGHRGFTDYRLIGDEAHNTCLRAGAE